ncbi:hypothetical protein [Agromyces albus]|uniref:hypothetical protein n=1 Tax=Agromyces albus TaxID=205332 RepID=UPI00277D72A8|nr:hypothetical protein [Agromyces albus]MDQ0574028.1 hypothetical protein [Agromyces albus]
MLTTEQREIFGLGADVLDHDYISAIIAGSRVQADELAGLTAEGLEAFGHRELMRAILVLVATDIATRGDETASRMESAGIMADRLVARQGSSGLFSSEGNLDSPPDTAFTINDLCSCVSLIDGRGDDVRVRWSPIRQTLERIALRAAPAVAAGGVHTPNHRWEVASALAGLNALWPDERLRARAELWLAEGIDIDADGLYSERSGIYAAEVTNPSLLSIARDLGRPELRDVVLRNLRAYAHLVEDDGEVENVHSRRQDQRLAYDVELFLSPLRQLAIAHGDADLARLAEGIVRRGLVHPGRHLAELVRHPEIGGRLPEATDPQPAEAQSETDVFYPVSRLLRVRRGQVSASIFAGSDFSKTGRIASGLSNSATLVRARRGALVLRSVRLAPTFFSMGCIRPDGLERVPNGAVLRETRSSGYYEPLAPDVPRDLSDPVSEGRYFAAMDFENRAIDPMSLRTTVTAVVDDAGVSLDFSFGGAATRYAVELVFDGELTVNGGEPFGGGWWLRGRTAEVAGFGAGASITASGFDDAPPDFDEGEMFGYVGGNDSIEGTRLLLSGSTTAASSLRIDLV